MAHLWNSVGTLLKVYLEFELESLDFFRIYQGALIHMTGFDGIWANEPKQTSRRQPN